MKKLILILSIIVACIFILASFNPVVGYFSANNYKVNNSPLFTVRTKRVQNQPSSLLTSQYFGKNIQTDIALPTRNIIRKNMLKELSKIDIQKKIGDIDESLIDKWQVILQLAENNLEEINKIIREEYNEMNEQIDKYLKLTDNELKQELLTKIDIINIDEEDISPLSNSNIYNQEPTNITSGPICNITSGPICQLTSQPICDLTSQPICNLITITPMCLTVLGLRCPSAGIKCNKLPTTGTICTFLAKLGPILKAIAVILIIALIIFIPIIILISVLNTNTCTNIREQITIAFNCTASR